jgi:hypothetical protein
LYPGERGRGWDFRGTTGVIVMLRLFAYVTVYGAMAGFMGLFCFAVHLPDWVQSLFKAFWRRRESAAVAMVARE